MIKPPKNDIQLPSNKAFGFFFTAVFIAAATYAFFSTSYLWSGVLTAVGSSLAIVTMIAAHRLAKLNNYWYRLGILIGRIGNPVVLGILYFFILTPIALIQKTLFRDELRLRKVNTASYWVIREEQKLSPQSFKRQF